jgi:hypothetical protein
LYTNLLIAKEPMYLHFKPYPGAFPGNELRVAPDLLPSGSIAIETCEVDGQPYRHFNASALSVTLPDTRERVRVRVKITPTTWLDRR